HVIDGSANGHSPIADDGELHAGWNRPLHLGNLGADLADDFDDISARLPLDIDDDSRSPLIPAAGAIVFQPVDDNGNVANGNRRAVTVGDDDWLVSLCCCYLIVSGDGVGLLRTIERALRSGDVRPRN